MEMKKKAILPIKNNSIRPTCLPTSCSLINICTTKRDLNNNAIEPSQVFFTSCLAQTEKKKLFWYLQMMTPLSKTFRGNQFYYMANFVSRQNEPNPALGLATRAGELALSCLLVTARCVPQETFPRKPYDKSFIDQASSIKIAVLCLYLNVFYLVITRMEYTWSC